MMREMILAGILGILAAASGCSQTNGNVKMERQYYVQFSNGEREWLTSETYKEEYEDAIEDGVAPPRILNEVANSGQGGVAWVPDAPGALPVNLNPDNAIDGARETARVNTVTSTRIAADNYNNVVQGGNAAPSAPAPRGGYTPNGGYIPGDPGVVASQGAGGDPIGVIYDSNGAAHSSIEVERHANFADFEKGAYTRESVHGWLDVVNHGAGTAYNISGSARGISRMWDGGHSRTVRRGYFYFSGNNGRPPMPPRR